MRKWLRLLCLITLCALIPSAALAITQAEWNQKCRYKAGADIPLYAIDVAEDGTKTARAIGTIPAGSYLTIGGTDYDLHMRLVVYLKNGIETSGYIHRSAPLGDATETIHFSDGTAVTIPEAIANDPAALQSWIDRMYPGKTLNGSGSSPVSVDGTRPLESGDSGHTGSSGASPDSDAQPRSSQATSRSGLTATLDSITVPVLRLGVYESVILADNAERTVSTAALTFADDVPAEKAVAVIHAPSTGKCTLRRAASASAKSLGKCKAGTIVAVLEYGGKFCRIHYGGEVGYVLSSCLKFYGEAKAPVGTGVLTWNGKATGRTTINIRNAADSDAHRIAQWPTGTEVVVFGRDGRWFEIEHDGMHGFVHEDYLTMSE